jgi:hypothetical protein
MMVIFTNWLATSGRHRCACLHQHASRPVSVTMAAGDPAGHPRDVILLDAITVTWASKPTVWQLARTMVHHRTYVAVAISCKLCGSNANHSGWVPQR